MYLRKIILTAYAFVISQFCIGNNSVVVKFEYCSTPDSIIIGYPLNQTIYLDSGCIATTEIEIDNPIFTNLKYGTEKLPIFLIPNSGLKIQIVENEVRYSGGLGAINELLSTAKSKLKSYNDSIFAQEKLASIIEYSKGLEEVKEGFDKIISSSVIHFSCKEILEKDLEALIYNNLINFTYRVGGDSDFRTDHLKRIYNSHFFKDSLLIQSNSSSFKNYLLWFTNEYLKNNLDYAKLQPAEIIWLSNSTIDTSELFSSNIKEFMKYYSLIDNINSYGFNNEIDSLCDLLSIEYPESIYKKQIDRMKKEYSKLKFGSVAPNLSGKDTVGKEFDLNQCKGKIVFIDVWSTGCIPCIKQHPDLILLQNEFNEDVIFLYVSRDRDMQKWKRYLKENSNLKGIHINNTSKDFTNNYKITGIPRYIIIDENGKIFNAFAYFSIEYFRSSFQELLSRK